jgi:hypothetical protein
MYVCIVWFVLCCMFVCIYVCCMYIFMYVYLYVRIIYVCKFLNICTYVVIFYLLYLFRKILLWRFHFLLILFLFLILFLLLVPQLLNLYHKRDSEVRKDWILQYNQLPTFLFQECFNGEQSFQSSRVPGFSRSAVLDPVRVCGSNAI